MGRKIVQEERRLQIIDALFTCLLEKPFKETSIKEIAMAAGVNHGVLHYYFKDKEEILLTFLDHKLLDYKNDFITHINSSISADSTPRQIIIEMFNFANQRITLDNRLSKIFMEIWEIALYDRKVRAKLKILYNEWIQMAQVIILRCVKDDALARRMSTSIVAFLEGMSMLSIILDLNKTESAQILKDFQQKIIDMLG